ncbi:hypothetical protein [Deinococcus pimensis]|uniref:phage NrS-1 polymerase family protein n=1 Tax=Deinococcus pimensis TaxID=309888 RepID=UPI000481D83E|nr:hypothetical protein [Deinococcus pimensis]
MQTFSPENPSDNLALRELAQFPIWVVWAYEDRPNRAGVTKRTKSPYQPRAPRFGARSNDPRTWASYDLAVKVCERHGFDGVGFNVHATGYLGLDFDWKDWDGEGVPGVVQDMIDRAGSYAEITPSGRGARVILRGHLPEGVRHKVRLDVGVELEAYCSGRFFTITGNAITPHSITDGAGFVEELVRTVLAPAPRVSRATPVTGRLSGTVNLSDAQVWQRMFDSKSGAAIRALATGDVSAHGGDHSAADFALCGHLAFWTGGDAARMDALFRQTGLMRDKWDEKHYADGATYGQRTIERVLARWDGRSYSEPRGPLIPQDIVEGSRSLWEAHYEDVLDRAISFIGGLPGHPNSKTALAELIADVYVAAASGNIEPRGEHLAVMVGGTIGLSALGRGRPVDISARLQHASSLGLLGRVERRDPSDPRSPLVISVPLDPRFLAFLRFTEEHRKSLAVKPQTYAVRRAARVTDTTRTPTCEATPMVSVPPATPLAQARLTAAMLSRTPGLTPEQLALRAGRSVDRVRADLSTLAERGYLTRDGALACPLRAYWADAQREVEVETRARHRLADSLERARQWALRSQTLARLGVRSEQRVLKYRRALERRAEAGLDALAAGEPMRVVLGVDA